MANNHKHLDLPTLESWPWDAACVIRGPLDAPKFKDYILPLVSLRRLWDVFEDEFERVGQEFGDARLSGRFLKDDHKLVCFYIGLIASWGADCRQTTGLGEYLTDVVRVVAWESPKLQRVFDVMEFNATTLGAEEGRTARDSRDSVRVGGRNS